ncbi:MAG: hypothetical protein IJ019_05770, partial [Alphaproteobacteria bacterium]|nr:hypothetical protein [Alphaproteobacteria bacterium]
KCGVSAVIKSFLRRMAQMRRCFLTKCTIWVGDDKNTKQMSCYAKETGRSMVEMLGVLAIIGVLSVGGIAGYSKAMSKYKVNKFMDQMTTIIANVRTAFGTQKTVNGLNNENIKKMGLVPEDMYVDKNSDYPQHFWGGQIYFGVPSYSTFDENGKYTGSVSPDDIFYISMNRIPKDVCMSVLTADWGQDLVGMGASFLGGSPTPGSVDYREASENLAKPGDKDYPYPYPMTRAEKICVKAEERVLGSSGMTFYWYFKL